MLTRREQSERRESMQNALASQRLEGLEPDAQTIADAERWTRGEVEIAEVIANFANRVKRGEVHG